MHEMEKPNLDPKEDAIWWNVKSRQLECDCGWVYKHERFKVLNKAIDRHTAKKGHKFNKEQK